MADPTQSNNTISTVYPLFCDEAFEGDNTIPRSPLHTITYPCTTKLDLSLDTSFEKRFDAAFVALSLSLIPTLEIIRFYNVISPFPTNEPCAPKVHLPNLRSLELIEHGSGIVALLSQLSIPTNTILDIEASIDTTLTTSIELIAMVGHILEGSDGTAKQPLRTLSLMTEYGRLIINGYDYLSDSGDPELPAGLRLFLPAINWTDRNRIVEGIAYSLPISRVETVHTDTSLLNTLHESTLKLFLWSLCSLKKVTWMDPDFPVSPDKAAKEQRYWASCVDVRAGGESNILYSLCYMQQRIEDGPYRDVVMKLLVVCVLAGFRIHDLDLRP